MLYEFKGIMYSGTTEIFFAFKDGKLYKFPIYAKATRKWSLSDYKGYNNNHRGWKDVTEEQVDLYNLAQKYFEIEVDC